MTKKWTFKHDRKGYFELMKSSGTKNMLMPYASKLKQSLGTGYETENETGRTRSSINVYAQSHKARSDNARNNTILKSLGGMKRG